ncbi:hypothetical protein J2T08_002846 [Neorhizobium galegae]|uniref:hypothetical protein n=1 Tax=Neorhizobium galegae TaxID=399 RepID=UPI0027828547|nr:hypothetical protein [Neorhizobium galegae]MDQ0134928.1 hypothetical protein [Neorhizobium galegae]
MNTILVPLFLIGARGGTAWPNGEAFVPKKLLGRLTSLSADNKKTREACHSLRAPLPSPHHGYAACNSGTWLRETKGCAEGVYLKHVKN